MPLVVNGVTIPENVANALMVNGVSITQVIANGVAVWSLALGPTVGWSGDVTATYFGYPGGMDINESNLMSMRAISNGSAQSLGAWMFVNSDGSFSGTSSASSGNYALTITGSGNILTFGGSGSIVYNPASKSFSGGPAYGFGSDYRFRFEASGLNLRCVMELAGTGETVGSWRTLS